MTELGATAYAGAFVGSALLSWAITPWAIRAAVRLDWLDEPGEIKAQTSAIPYLGGAPIVLAFVIAVLAANVVVRPVGGLEELSVVLALALGLAAVGLVDDVRGLGPYLRLAFEILAAVVLLLSGVSVAVTGSPAVDSAFTILWVVGLTNAFNLLDNMDGLSAGIALIAASWFFALAALSGQFLVASLAIALAGCALGFLRHNFHPARVYMGDAGSLFLGFMLAVIGLKLRFPGPVNVTFLVPILVGGVAIFDTVLVTVERLRHGRNPLSGGRDHTSHRLVAIGIPVPFAVTVIYGAAVSLGWMALVISRLDRTNAYLLAGLVLFVAAGLGTMLAQVPVYRMSAGPVGPDQQAGEETPVSRPREHEETTAEGAAAHLEGEGAPPYPRVGAPWAGR